MRGRWLSGDGGAVGDRRGSQLRSRFPFCWRSTFPARRPSTASRPRASSRCLAELAGYRNVAVRGLMCMAGLEGGLDVARRDFAALRQLRDRLRPRCPPGVALDELSMGMSGDFEMAIEEGATIVRVGSALFEGVESNP